MYPTPKGYFQRRFLFIALSTLAIAICYVTRVVLSVTIIKMQNKYDWSNSFKGFILAAFSLGYCMTQIPAQYLCDRFGGKKVIFTGLTMSIFTLFLVPLAAHNKVTIILVRVFCGIFQGVSFSTMNWLIGRWIPICQRSSSASFIWSGVYSGTVIGDFITPVLLSFVSWEASFYIIGGGCLIWSILWFIFISDFPKDIKLVGIHENEVAFINHGKTMDKELELKTIGDTDTGNPTDENQSTKKPFLFVMKTFLKSKPMLALMYLNISCNWGYFLLLSWAPTYLSKQLGNSDGFKFAFFNSLPFIVGFLNSIVFGFVSDKLLAKGFKKLYIYLRKTMGCLCYGIPGIFLFLTAYAPIGTTGKIIFMTISIAANGFTSSGSNLCTLDLTKRYSGVSMGLANFSLAIPNIIGPLLGGVLLSAFNNDWNPIFTISAGCYLAGAIVWLIFLKVDLVI
ncbi:hypothetical protein DICPUDRAFT_94474 [Dictyostelium purpureum]|uniref:Major facilitator superfamily (MFS) profile domain-containing protein n=1 Tax=Dictyostelium purpureum TaxID=5786 RepID=F0ZJX9_DICPU|nr:uncharacterized protein DICPUDRAFT_94474 [Dictyostelium purpureum]EGC35759.1 hypothetical protein DICPUDRAFT_94474 [Dictyostelium purpureum]|eukprot:XP_003287711.1 hypothetical protein DICPUDRAFT_94474 [Dictyostelium purpureum]